MSRLSSLARELRARGVTRIFGIPGTQTVPFIEAARAEGIQFELAAHECGAAFMAIGAARATGRTSVLCTIGGPGLTNALTGLIEARHDSVPILHIVNAPAHAPDRSFLLQAIDHEALASNAVKAVLRLGEGDDPADTVARALGHAEEGEPGPVLLELVTGGPGPEQASPADAGDAAGPDAAAWSRLGELWRAAQRPLVYAGRGAEGAHAAMVRLSERFRVPVMTTPSGRGVLPESHELALPFDPLRGGLDTANRMFDAADLVIAVGCKLTHNGSAGFGLRLGSEKLVHVDRSSAVLGANYPSKLLLRASAQELLDFLGDEGGREEEALWTDGELATAGSALRTPTPHAGEPRIAGRPAADFFAWLGGALPPGAVVVTDSGQHQIMTRRYHRVDHPGSLVFPSDYQSMGFGLPAAVGHRLAAPTRPAVALVGDGGFLMSAMELTAAVRAGVALPVMVFRDGYLGQIRLQQLRDSGHAQGVKLGAFDLEGIAHALGAGFVRFDWSTPPDLGSTIHDASGPTLIEVPVGDASSLAFSAARQRAKGAARAALGDGTIDRIKRLLGR
jgi:acetolactate synthase-1/2/3 large subunit